MSEILGDRLNIVYEDTLLEITPELMKKTILKQNKEIERLQKRIDKIDKLVNETIDEPLVEEDRFQYFYDKYWELKGDKE